MAETSPQEWPATLDHTECISEGEPRKRCTLQGMKTAEKPHILGMVDQEQRFAFLDKDKVTNPSFGTPNIFWHFSLL